MRSAVAIVLFVSTLAACSGDDDTATTIEEIDATTTAPDVIPPTTNVSTSTTVRDSTTMPDSTTTPPTSAAPTTGAETLPVDTTDGDLAALRDEVIAAASAAFEVSDRVRQNPDDADALAAMAEVMTAARIDYLMSNFVLFYRANDLVERPNPDLPASVEFRPETFVVDPAQGRASIELCYLSSNLLVEPGGNGDGTDKVHDDSFGSVLVRRDMVHENGRWLDDGGEDLVVSEGAVTCEPA